MKFSTTASLVCRSSDEKTCNMRYKASSLRKTKQSICQNLPRLVLSLGLDALKYVYKVVYKETWGIGY